MQDEPTRERLIAAALRLFGEKGYQSTSVADVQRESDCHSGSFYHFFPTKQDLLLAVLERYREGIVPMLIEPAWHSVQNAGWIIKYYPGVGFAMFVPVNINPVVF